MSISTRNKLMMFTWVVIYLVLHIAPSKSFDFNILFQSKEAAQVNDSKYDIVQTAYRSTDGDSESIDSNLSHNQIRTNYPQFIAERFPTNDIHYVNVSIETELFISEVSEAYIGVTFDMSLICGKKKWKKLDLRSDKLRTLFAGLSPSVCRFGGTSSAFVFFDLPSRPLEEAHLLPRTAILSKQDVLLLSNFTRSTGNRLVLDLNIELRYGSQWDPANAIRLFEFLRENGLTENVDFELGNEPDHNHVHGEEQLTPQQVASDFQTLHRVLQSYSTDAAGGPRSLRGARIYGPDISGIIPPGGLGYRILEAVANTTQSFLSAITIHHYYFKGLNATVGDFLDPKYFDNLTYKISVARQAMRGAPDLPLVLGETSDASYSGTPNISDRFVGGFLWMEKLGRSAALGVEAVFRQTLYGGNYGLLDYEMDPNPDYWLSLIHRRLVGRRALLTNLSSMDNHNVTPTLRLYAHCTRAVKADFPSEFTSTGNSAVRPEYPTGSVVIFGFNMSPNTTEILVLPPNLKMSKTADLFLLSAPQNNLLSKKVLLNGRPLNLDSGGQLPPTKPVKIDPSKGIAISPYQMIFVVLPDVKAKACF